MNAIVDLQRAFSALHPLLADLDLMQALGVAIVSYLGVRGMTQE